VGKGAGGKVGKWEKGKRRKGAEGISALFSSAPVPTFPLSHLPTFSFLPVAIVDLAKRLAVA
jgi:hypothetical protein